MRINVFYLRDEMRWDVDDENHDRNHRCHVQLLFLNDCSQTNDPNRCERQRLTLGSASHPCSPPSEVKRFQFKWLFILLNATHSRSLRKPQIYSMHTALSDENSHNVVVSLSSSSSQLSRFRINLHSRRLMFFKWFHRVLPLLLLRLIPFAYEGTHERPQTHMHILIRLSNI